MNDYISRQATLDAVDNIHQEHLYKQIGDKDTYTPYNEGWADACDRIDSVLRGLPSADVPHWISCSERLPEEGQWCLVSDKGHIAIDTFIGHGNPYNWHWYVRDYEAWMPLPEPYKEVEQNE